MGRKGFTIVELLIVIVVIAILAAITVVAYTGIQGRANDVAVQSDLRAFANKVLQIEAETGQYPLPQSSSSSAPQGFGSISVTKGAYDTGAYNLYYCTNSSSWAVGAQSKSGTAWMYTSSGGLEEFTATWGASATICPGMGVSSFDFSYGYNSSSGWFSWVTG